MAALALIFCIIKKMYTYEKYCMYFVSFSNWADNYMQRTDMAISNFYVTGTQLCTVKRLDCIFETEAVYTVTNIPLDNKK